MSDKNQLKIEIVMMAVQRRVLPLKDETAVQHAVRAYKIAQDCMAALEDADTVEPAPAAPAAVSDWTVKMVGNDLMRVWTASGTTWVTISKQLKD